MKKTGISRRDFLRGAAAGALGAATAGLLGACAPAEETSSVTTTSQAADATTALTTAAPSSAAEQETTASVSAPEALPVPEGVPAWLGAEPSIELSQIVEQIETEVLVVGSGSAGWPAFASALESGAKAILIERLSALSSPKGDRKSVV